MNAPTQLVTEAPAEVTRATQQANALYTAAQALVVDSPEGYAAAGEELVDLRTRWKAIEAQRVHLKEPYLEGGRRIDAFFAVPLKRLADAAELVKAGMLVFKTAEDEKAERLRREQQERERAERAELERQQREAAERERLAREEADRIAREAQERADAEQRRLDAEAAEARRAGDEAAAAEAEARAQAAQEQADREALAAREAADQEALAAQQQANDAQTAMDLADVAPAPLVPVSAAVAAGVSGRKTWKVKSIDKRALVIAAGKAAEAGDDAMLAYLDVNETVLNGIAKALKSAARVAGVVFGEVTTLAATGRR